MEYTKCQQHEDNDSNVDYDEQEEERFEDEPSSQRKRQPASRPFDENNNNKNPPSRKIMAPLELELRVLGGDNDDDNDGHHDGDSAEEDAVSLLGGGSDDAGGGGGGEGSRIAGDFYYSRSSNASFDDGSVYSRRSTTRDFYNSTTDGTLRVWYGCAFIVLSLLVAAIFVAPSPGNSNRHKTAGDSHYRSPASSASSSQTKQLACELEFTNNTSWTDFLQNISDPNYGMRCSSRSSSTSQQQQTSCTCQNPAMADFPHQPRSYAQKWQKTFHQNLERIGQWEEVNADATSHDAKNLDVVFLGDSIMEHWVGTSLGVPHSKLSGNVRVFQSLFGDVTSSTQQPSSETNLLGMALGISGDRCPNLLYRLQNGELGGSVVAAAESSSKLQPKIWWILIGTNDLRSDKCAGNQVIAGIITIVEYLRRERPQATIVINSILPCYIRDDTTTSSTSPEAALLDWRDYYQPVNQALECYVHGQENNDDDAGKLYFFNATDLFLTSDGLRINRTRLPDNLHPGEEGSRIWGTRIQEEIQAILVT